MTNQPCAGITLRGGSLRDALDSIAEHLDGKHGKLSPEQRDWIRGRFWELMTRLGEHLDCDPNIWVPDDAVSDAWSELAPEVAHLPQEWFASAVFGVRFLKDKDRAFFALHVATTPVFTKHGRCIELAPGWPLPTS